MLVIECVVIGAALNSVRIIVDCFFDKSAYIAFREVEYSVIGDAGVHVLDCRRGLLLGGLLYNYAERRIIRLRPGDVVKRGSFVVVGNVAGRREIDSRNAGISRYLAYAVSLLGRLKLTFRNAVDHSSVINGRALADDAAKVDPVFFVVALYRRVVLRLLTFRKRLK